MVTRWITCCTIALGLGTASWAQPSPDPAADWERNYDCTFTSEAIVVDGVGDELAWQLAPAVGVFTRFQSDDTQPQYRTTARMLWDRDHLYFLIAAADPDIWSSMKEGDEDCLCLQETIELFIDPDGDGLDYAEIHINSLDTINDIWIPSRTFTYADGSPVVWPELYAWMQVGMMHATENHGTLNDSTDIDQGSVFELAMPWKGFGQVAGAARTPPVVGDIWRMNINRYERSRGTEPSAELSGWAPLDGSSYHVPDRFGYVRFVAEQD